MAQQNCSIVVLFRKGMPAEEMVGIVKAQGCTLANGHTGIQHAKVVIVPQEKRVEDYAERFEKLNEVTLVSLSD